MAQQTIGIGASANDGTGDTIRDAFDKCNDNFTELYAGLVGLLDFKGSTDCSANPNYPAASKGDFYLVSVAGKIGGASGVTVEVGDSYFATADNAGGTQASVGSSWTVIQGNITAYLPLSGGTLTGDLIVPDEAYDATAWDGSLEVPTKNAVRDKIEAIVAGGGSSITVKDEGSDLTTSLSSLDFVGSGVTATNTGGAVTVTVSGGGSGNAWSLQWSPLDNEPPSSNYATLDTRNGHPCLDFDTTTSEAAIFSGVLPADYSGAGITVHIYCSLTSATSGTVGWLVSIERMDASSLDIDADSFASANTLTAATVPGTSGQLLKMSLNISNGANMDSLAAGEMFRLKIARDTANDTATGDAEILRVMMVSQ